MATPYHPFIVNLTDEQKQTLRWGAALRTAVSLYFESKQIAFEGDCFLFTPAQIKQLMKADSAHLLFSKEKISKLKEEGVLE